MAVEPSALRRELIGFAGIVERNVYLIRRFAWWELAWFLYTVANTLTIVFIAKGIEQAGGKIDVNRATIVLLVGAVIMPMPMNEKDETAITRVAARKSGSSKLMSRNTATDPNSRMVRSTP